MPRPRFLKKAFAVPSNHGSWVWWLGPFVIGAAAGGHLAGDTAALFIGGLAAFLAHHPTAVAVKAATGRRSRADLRPALAWVVVYAAIALSAVPCLVHFGHTRVLWLALPGVLVFALHLVLVARRRERRQMAIEILETGVLALAAPAAYAVSGGAHAAEGWALWSLCWAQSAGAVANVFVQLPPRATDGASRVPTALSVALQSLGLVLVVALAAIGEAPPFAIAAFAFVAAEALGNVMGPPAGRRPSEVGVRQLVVSTIFVTAMIVAWRA